MKNRICILSALLMTLGSSSLSAYELATHGAITYEAFKRSVLNPKPNDPPESRFLTNVLGVQNGPNPFGESYYDVSGTTVYERKSQQFEQDPNAKRMPPGMEPLSIEGWFLRGSIREDDYLEPDNGQPLDDPYNGSMFPAAINDNRPLHHFYDPVRDRPLTAGITLGRKAPDWALGTSNVFSDRNVPLVPRRNHFTIFDAREAMYRVLTRKRGDKTNCV